MTVFDIVLDSFIKTLRVSQFGTHPIIPVLCDNGITGYLFIERFFPLVSASFESKLSKISHIEENKQKYKYKICLLNYTDLFHLLDINKTDNNNKEKENDSTGNTNQKEINDMEKEALKQKIKELDDIIKNTNIDVKNNYLRRIVCLKLYKALIFSLKYFDLNKKEHLKLDHMHN